MCNFLVFRAWVWTMVLCGHPGGLFNDSPSDKLGWSSNLNFQDIDNDHSDPQMCSMYATDIYVHLRMAEVRFLTSLHIPTTWSQHLWASMNPSSPCDRTGWVPVELTWIARPFCIPQIKRRPTTNFMEVMQQDINPSMRGILIDWLVEVLQRSHPESGPGDYLYQFIHILTCFLDA